MIEAYKLYWTKAFDFKGVSTRSQFWWSYLATFVVYILLTIITTIGAYISEILGGLLATILILYCLGIIVPSVAICIRRTNDAGKPWAWIFINLVPFGGLYYLYLLCPPSLPIG